MIGINMIARLRITLLAAARILLVVGLLFGTAAGADASLSETSAAAPSPAQGAGEADVTHLVVENVGQFASGARFLIKQGDQRVWLADGALWLTIPDPLPADAKAPRVGARIEREVGRPRQPRQPRAREPRFVSRSRARTPPLRSSHTDRWRPGLHT